MRFGIKIVPIAMPLGAVGLAALALAGAAPAKAAVGAFAYDEATGKYGASWNEPDEKAAEEAALKGCASDKCKIVFRTKAGQCGAIAAINALIGAWTESRKRDLFASNQARSLCAFSSRKNAKKSFGNPWNASAIAPPKNRKPLRQLRQSNFRSAIACPQATEPKFHWRHLLSIQ